MANILVIDDSSFWRNLVTDGLRLKGHHVTAVEDGVNGLSLANRGEFDLIVVDTQLPGMPGLCFLDQANHSQCKSLPIVILTGEILKEQVVRARDLGAVDYLLKPQFSLSELIDRVERRLDGHSPASGDRSLIKGSRPESAAIPRVLLTREQCLDRAVQAMGVRTLSGVVAKVIASASSPRTDLSDLAALVGCDPMLSARVIAAANRLENSADRRVISNLVDAVRVIGSSTIRDIASSFLVFDVMPLADPDGYNPIRCWQHSIAVARLCNLLAGEEHRSIAYLLGLCHDLGEILFRSHFGSEYREVLEMSRLTGMPRSELERQMLGLTHGELVQCILKQLDLPDAIWKPIAAFHAATEQGSVASASAARLLLIADAFSTALMLNSSEQSGLRPLNKVECRLATGMEDPPQINSATFRAEVVALTAECARLNAREQAELTPPSPVKRFAKVWLARESSYSSFDPIATALEPMVELSVNHRLPKPAELSTQHGVIVVTRNGSAHGLTPEDVEACLGHSDPVRQSVLYLTGKDLPHTDHPAIAYANWPVSFTRLAAFVGALR